VTVNVLFLNFNAKLIYTVFQKITNHYSGEAAVCTIYFCEIISGFCASKSIKIGSVFAELFKV